PAKVRVRVVDPGVDDRYTHVLTMQPGRALPRLRRADERHAFRIDEVIGPNRFDFDDSRQRGKRPDLLGRAAHLDPVDGVLELPEHGAAHPLDGRHDRVLPATQVALDRLALRLGELLAWRAAAHHGDRIARHFEDDRVRALPQQAAGNRGSSDAVKGVPTTGLCRGRDRYQGDERKGNKAAADESKGSRWSRHVSDPLVLFVATGAGSICRGRRSRILAADGYRLSLMENPGQPSVCRSPIM